MQWAATAAFYCALHCVEAALADHRLRSRHHRHRKALMWQVGVDPVAEGAYEALEQMSEGARYRGQPFTATDVTDSVLGRELPLATHWIGL